MRHYGTKFGSSKTNGMMIMMMMLTLRQPMSPTNECGRKSFDMAFDVIQRTSAQKLAARRTVDMREVAYTRGRRIPPRAVWWRPLVPNSTIHNSQSGSRRDERRLTTLVAARSQLLNYWRMLNDKVTKYFVRRQRDRRLTSTAAPNGDR